MRPLDPPVAWGQTCGVTDGTATLVTLMEERCLTVLGTRMVCLGVWGQELVLKGAKQHREPGQCP